MKIETIGKSFVTLTKDPKDVGNKSAVAIFGVAENHSRKDKNGKWVEDGTSFWNIVAFGDLAEDVLDELGKGDAVRIVGKVRMETWEDKEGDKHTTPKIILESFEKVEFEKKSKSRRRDDDDDEKPSRGRSRRDYDDDEEDRPSRGRRDQAPARGNSRRQQSTRNSSRNSGRKAPWND